MGKDLRGKELGEGLTQLKDGRYIGRYTNSYGKRITLYGNTLKETKDKLNKARFDKFSHMERSANKDITLKQLYEEWIVDKEQKVRVLTISNVKNLYHNHIEDYEMIKLSKITPMFLLNFFRNLDEKKYKPNTIYRIREIFSDLLSFGAKKQYIFKSPFELFEMPKVIKDKRLATKASKEENNYLTKEVREIFFDYIERNDVYLGSFYKFLLLTGTRISEAVAITWDCIDFKNNLISIKKNFVQYYIDGKRYRDYDAMPKSICSIRTVPITSELLSVLKKQKSISKSEFVFCTKKGTPLVPKNVGSRLTFTVDKINSELEQNAKKEKNEYNPLPNITPHFFRHTFATICLENGINPKVVQKIMGHSTVEITLNIYTHLSSEFKVAELSKIDTFI